MAVEHLQILCRLEGEAEDKLVVEENTHKWTILKIFV